MGSDWIETTLGELCVQQGGSIQTGPFGSQLHASDYSEVGTPVVMPVNLVAGNVSKQGIARVGDEHVAKLSRHKLKPADIVFSRRGDVTRFALVSDRESGWLCGTGCLKISLGEPALAVPQFIAGVLSLPETKEWLVQHAVGATMPNLNTGILSAIPVRLPDLGTQKQVAGLLDTMKSRIDKLRQTNASLEAIAQALFKSWFVDFDPVHAKAESREPEGMDAATAALFPSEFEDSELGPIPKKWETKFLKDVASIVKGRSYKSAELEASDTALVTLKSFNRGGGFRRDGFKPYIGPYKEEQLVQEGDCIVSFTDVTQQADLIGRSAIVTGSAKYKRLVASLDVGVLRPKAEGITSFFLRSLLSGDRYVSHIKGFVTGTTVLHLAKDGLPTYMFAMPPIELVNRWTEVAGSCGVRQALNVRKIDSLIAMRDALLPRLISGRLRLPEAEVAIEEAMA